MNTVQRTQQLFRQLMYAMAHPGEIMNVRTKMTGETEPVFTMLCASLLDHEVTYTVIGHDVQESFIDSIRHNTGARYVAVENAQYVIVTGGSSDGYIRNCSVGSMEYPDRGATVIYRVADLSKTTGISLLLRGPGIRESVSVVIDGISQDEFVHITAMNCLYPCGIDVIFCDDDALVCLPRTTKIEFAAKE